MRGLIGVLVLAVAACGGRKTTADGGGPELGPNDARVEAASLDLPPVRFDGLPDGRIPDARRDLPGLIDMSDPDFPVPDQSPVADLPVAWDGQPPCPPFVGTIGKVCSGPGSCGTGHYCMAISTTSSICTRTCTPDNPATPLVNEDDCPSGNVCGTLGSGSTGQNFCFRKCAPKLGCDDCDTGVSCHPSSGSYVGLRKQAVCLFAGCTSNSGCPVTTGTACDTVQQNCPAGQSCVPTGQGTSSSTLGICAKPGLCDLASGLCAPHNQGIASAKVGDPCNSDLECGNAMYCLFEVDEAKLLKKGGDTCTDNGDCCSGTCLYGACTAGLCEVRYRNGYCTVLGCTYAGTLPFRACPTGSTCNHLYGGGLCQLTCTLAQASSCRNNPADLWGDYECRNWSKISLQGAPAAGGPVCDFGFAVPCSIWWQTGVDCTVLGDTNNPTNMSCRDYKGNAITNPYSPDGRCFDNTASGTAFR